MTDAHFEAEPDGVPGAGEPTRTGVAEVDEVLRAVAELDPSDVASHPAVFERAHEQLRRALDGPA